MFVSLCGINIEGAQYIGLLGIGTASELLLKDNLFPPPKKKHRLEWGKFVSDTAEYLFFFVNYK